MSWSDRAETTQGQMTMEKNLEHFYMYNMCREIFKAEKLRALKSQSCDVLTTREQGSFQMTNVTISKVDTTLTNECPSPKISFPQKSQLSDMKNQVLHELKFKLES